MPEHCAAGEVRKSAAAILAVGLVVAVGDVGHDVVLIAHLWKDCVTVRVGWTAADKLAKIMVCVQHVHGLDPCKLGSDAGWHGYMNAAAAVGPALGFWLPAFAWVIGEPLG